MTADDIAIFTIGVYGKTEDEFFGQLVDSDIHLFLDVRARRGIRGNLYTFANSKALQQRLSELGIAYLHADLVAPLPKMRQVQKDDDEEAGIAKRERVLLTPEFIEVYKKKVLRPVVVNELKKKIVSNLRGKTNVCLFCVEAEASACHRSLIAVALADRYGFTVTHL